MPTKVTFTGWISDDLARGADVMIERGVSEAMLNWIRRVIGGQCSRSIRDGEKLGATGRRQLQAAVLTTNVWLRYNTMYCSNQGGCQSMSVSVCTNSPSAACVFGKLSPQLDS